MHEVEIRGPIEDFDEILTFFNKEAKFIGEKDPRDLRLRVTNKKAELVIKYGQ